MTVTNDQLITQHADGPSTSSGVQVDRSSEEEVSLSWEQTEEVGEVSELEETQAIDSLPKDKQDESRLVASFAAHVPPSFEAAIVKGLEAAGIDNASAVVNSWVGAVRARSATATHLETESAAAERREAACQKICQEAGVDFPGMVYPCGAANEGTGVILAWAPWHSDRHVLTTLKHTPRLVLQTGYEGFAIDLLEPKMEAIDHQRLPPPATSASKLASGFPMGKRDAQHLDALTRMLDISLSRCLAVSKERAAFPSLTIGEGQHVEQNVQLFLDSVTGVEHGQGTLSLSTAALFARGTAYPCHLPFRFFFKKDGKNGIKLLGLFVFTVHGSQGRYLGGRGGDLALANAYGLDLTLDFAVSLQPHATPRPRRFAHTLAAWLRRGLTERQFQFELRVLRRREMEGGPSPGSVDDLPVEHRAWIEALKLVPPTATKTSGNTTILAVFCSALSTHYRLKLSPEQKEQRKKRCAETREGWSEEQKKEYEEKLAPSRKRGGEKSWAYHSVEEKADRVSRTFDTPDSSGLTGREKAKLTVANNAKGPSPLRSPSAIAADPSNVLCMILLYDAASGAFQWHQDNSGTFTLKDHAAHRLCEGRTGQLFTQAEFDKVSAIASPHYAVEAWFCSVRKLLYVRPTKRLPGANFGGSRLSASNSVIEVMRSTTNCLICNSVTTGSTGAPNCKPLECRPVAGWQRWEDKKKGRTTQLGPRPDLAVPDLDRRVVSVNGIPERKRGKKGQKSSGSESKVAPQHHGLHSLASVPIGLVTNPTEGEGDTSDAEVQDHKRQKLT